MQGKSPWSPAAGGASVRPIAGASQKQGPAVVIASRKLENLEATAKEFASLPGRVVPIACHVGRLDQLENLIRQTEAQLGPVDILVNNSATNLGQGPHLEVTDDMLEKIIRINV